MHFYLAPYTGDGTPMDNPFTPRGSDQPGWSAIDLRRDSSVVTGRCLVAVPVRDDTIGQYLGDAPDEVSAAVKSLVENRLGITLEATRPRGIIAELLMVHGRTDGTRWKPLRPSRVRRQYEIHLGGRDFWTRPVLAGGATHTDSFTAGDSSTLSGDLTWNEYSASKEWAVASNRASMTGNGGWSRARADHDLDTDDHYAEATLVACTPGSTAAVGVICRKDGTTTETFYGFWPITGGGTGHRLRKFVTGTETVIEDIATTFSANEVAKVQADGSSITGWLDGVQVADGTDTDITGNLRTGIVAFSNAGGTSNLLDDFTAEDVLAAAATFTRLVGGRFRLAGAGGGLAG